ncbi:LytR C-terminal domain-containing protein [Rhodococcus sp. P1Y]|uniref:LytR C-terminal domain-containing protein n=1 Tax=Rhodococcus sp. P1Y TaxID=1302308 RepID=UPI001F193F46|nr:LytR C-terminal domain-containing protein [Rhodococcus sp. P1Y]
MSSPNPESSGPPLRALAMVLISLAILFAAIGALSLTDSGGDEAAAPEATSEVAATTPASGAGQSPAVTSTTSSAPTTSAGPADIDLRVLNNSDVSGLAATTAATLTAEGWTIAETGNYAETQVASTTVYYGTDSGAESAAEEIAQQLGATAAALPRTVTGFGNGVIVMVTQ